MPIQQSPNQQAADTVKMSVDDLDIIQRVDRNLNEMEQWVELLSIDDGYEPATIDFAIPDGFRITVVVPVYNEEATLSSILSRVDAIPLPKQVVIVDDCSTDSSRDILRQLEGHPDYDLVLKDRNEGKGAALHTGFEHAKGDVVVVQDADLEYDPRDLVSLVKPIIDDEADVVYGSRFLHEEQQDPSFLHRLINALLTQSSNLFNGTRLTDMETCYKVFKREVIQGIELKQKRFGFEPEVTAKIARRKHRIVELPITYDGRPFSEGKKIGIYDVFEAFWCIARYGIAD